MSTDTPFSDLKWGLLYIGARYSTPDNHVHWGYPAMTREESEEWDKKVAAAQPSAQAAIDQLAAITDPVARLVLDLHGPVGRTRQCDGCDSTEDYASWPCTTTETIAKHYGIDMSQVHLYVWPKEQA